MNCLSLLLALLLCVCSSHHSFMTTETSYLWISAFAFSTTDQLSSKIVYSFYLIVDISCHNKGRILQYSTLTSEGSFSPHALYEFGRIMLRNICEILATITGQFMTSRATKLTQPLIEINSNLHFSHIR